MKTSFMFITMLVILFSINSCQSEDNSLLSGNTENTRKVFVNADEYKVYLEELKKTDGSELRASLASSETTNQTIVDKFLYLSSLDQVFNENYEFQIDNQIIKLGKSGYTTYIIDVPYYQRALRLIDNESSLIINLSRYKQIENELYQISEGLILHYSGNPLIEEQEITDNILNDDKVTTRAALNPYELKVSFWSTSNFVFNGCGVEISYKEADRGKLKDYNTDLGMYWQGIVTSHKAKDDRGMGQISYFGSGYKLDTGSSDKNTFGEVGGVFMHRFKYYLIGGAIWGTARHSSGTTIQKGQFD